MVRLRTSDGADTVSYTHLDVYKRQEVYGALVDVYQHDHCKYIFHYILRNVDDVDLLLIERCLLYTSRCV